MESLRTCQNKSTTSLIAMALVYVEYEPKLVLPIYKNH